ncbi:MAG: formylmethanofuran dehydrogenase [Candidatus Methanogaster sp.]|uniref:Formylmethanofuran dehydrogenase n=1 Tax=Candidatus Methanogaster sp. TaxID=3386292 RepID=A0AC61KYZ5_9EURY|nr:MAG: formylmethanofuran dehydrogenase [ANME-2 cluster archaeon]
MMKMEFGEFLAAPECKVVIVTYPDLFRTEAWLRHGKFSSEYRELSAVIVLDPADMAKIEVKDGDLVEVLGEEGVVVVRVKESEKEHPGIGYMPEGAWANVLGAGPASAKVGRSQQEILAIEDVYRR